jgi:hypothetical protein
MLALQWSQSLTSVKVEATKRIFRALTRNDRNGPRSNNEFRAQTRKPFTIS